MNELIPLKWESDSNEEIEHYFPAKYEVCDVCEGKGSYVNRNIDGNGITSSEWEEAGEEFQEDYMSGKYDVQCEECKGLRVILFVDEDALLPEEKSMYEEFCTYEDRCAQFDYEDTMTRRMESGRY